MPYGCRRGTSLAQLDIVLVLDVPSVPGQPSLERGWPERLRGRCRASSSACAGCQPSIEHDAVLAGFEARMRQFPTRQT